MRAKAPPRYGDTDIGDMEHYCRYCIHCIAQDETEAVCEELNIIVKKTSIRNACKSFDFCEIDAFYICRGGTPENCRYKPRIPEQGHGMYEQLELSQYLYKVKAHMKVLVACEESQRVCTEFRQRGHEAYSCDIEPCSGGHPEWHIKADVLPLLNGSSSFRTVDGTAHRVDGKWDMIVAFPPCTHLASSGARYFKEKREDGRQEQGIDFFMQFVHADCGKIAIENPVGIMSGIYRKPDQIIQPYEFGDAFEKRTCLWLKGLPKLMKTNIVGIPERQKLKSGKTMPAWYSKGGRDRQKNRSKTFTGIAKAMAEQWG